MAKLNYICQKSIPWMFPVKVTTTETYLISRKQKWRNSHSLLSAGQCTSGLIWSQEKLSQNLQLYSYCKIFSLLLQIWARYSKATTSLADDAWKQNQSLWDTEKPGSSACDRCRLWFLTRAFQFSMLPPCFSFSSH